LSEKSSSDYYTFVLQGNADEFPHPQRAGWISGNCTHDTGDLRGRALGLLRTPPPAQITANVQRRLTNIENSPEHIPEPVFHTSWLLSHFGYGTGCGVLYSPLRPLLPPSLALRGLAYGLAVWGISYINLMPQLRLYPAVREDRLSQTAVMIAAHVVYGVALLVLERQLVQRDSRSR
jgi:uncharacterized membrane protein YagU involved in acid resistance